jgi:hypothetical protein
MSAFACLLLVGLLTGEPTSFRFQVKDGALFVRGAGQRAPLSVEAAHPDMHPALPLSVKPRYDGTTWTLAVDVNCQGLRRLTFSDAALEARLENAAGDALAGRRQWAAAVPRFARAVDLDPGFAEAATNLAAAQARGGHERASITTLVAAAARDRVWTVWRVAVDRRLAGVAAAPEIRALAARTPGRVSLAKLRKSHLAYAPETKLVVWDRVVSNGMSEEVDGPMELRVADAVTGRLVARLRYRAGEEFAVGRALAALGFDTADVRPGRFASGDNPTPAGMRGVVPGSRLSVTVKGGRVTLRDQGRVIAAAPITAEPVTAWMAAAPGGVLIGAGVSIGDGCGAWEYDDMVWLPLGGATR